MLMHWDNIDGADEVKAWRDAPANKNLKKPGDDRTPAWTWATYLYTDGEHVTFPSENLMVCLRAAGAKVIMTGRTTFKAATQTGLLIDDEFLDFLVSDDRKVSMNDIARVRDLPFDQMKDEVEALGFKLFVKRAVIGTSKHIRVRPRFDVWTIRGSMEVFAPEITMEKLRTIFDIAGGVGLGDWRPGGKTPGPYGQFRVKLKKR